MAQEALDKAAKKLESEFWKGLMEGKPPSLEPKPTELTQYKPYIREWIASALKGDSYGGATERLVDNLLGTNSADIGLLDATPVGALMRAWEGANKVVKSDDPYERASGAVDMLPGGVVDKAVLLPIAAASRFGWKKFEKAQDLAHQIGAYLMDKMHGDQFPGIGDKYMDAVKKSDYVKKGMVSRHQGADNAVVVEVPDFGLTNVNRPGERMQHPSLPSKFYTDTLGVELPMYKTADLDGSYGSFEAKKNLIRTDIGLEPNELVSTASHEFQHFNDRSTGLPAGGNPDLAKQLQSWAMLKPPDPLAARIDINMDPYNLYRSFGGEIGANTSGARALSAVHPGSIPDVGESISEEFTKLQKDMVGGAPFSSIKDRYDELQNLLPPSMSETSGYLAPPKYRDHYKGKALPIANNRVGLMELWTPKHMKFSEGENMRAILELMEKGL